jgi:putative membrane protein
MRFGLLFSLVLAIIAVIFALQNPQPMDVNLLFFRTEGSTALVLILTFSFGILVGLLSSLPGRLRARRRLKELQNQVADQSDVKDAPRGGSPTESANGPSLG